MKPSYPYFTSLYECIMCDRASTFMMGKNAKMDSVLRASSTTGSLGRTELIVGCVKGTNSLVMAKVDFFWKRILRCGFITS